jgi:phage terminase large subunit-like protein
VEDLFDELDAFPNARHDDQVDALSVAWFALTKGGVGVLTAPPSTPRQPLRVAR